LKLEGDTIVLVTGREENRRSDTQVALRNAGVPYDQLLMNTIGPKKDQQLQSKEWNVRRLMLSSPVETVTDNDPNMQRIYKSLGLNVQGGW
jgi:hypothetical protein